jgi:hypothetical protein
MTYKRYTMKCEAGSYYAQSWLGLGWQIFTHRLSHLFKGEGFID